MSVQLETPAKLVQVPSVDGDHPGVLDLEDIQHFLLMRPRALAARYGFLTFRDAAQARQYVGKVAEYVGTGAKVAGATEVDSRWVTMAFTWNGLRALGVDEASLATFPEEFR